MATTTTNITNIYGGRHEPIRDPRFPTVKQWLDREAETNYKHRQPVGFTPKPPYTDLDKRAFDEMD